MRTKFLVAMLAATVVSAPAYAEAGDVYVRLRGILVAPNEKSGSVLPALPGEKVGVNNAATPEIDFTYMATDHIGFELIAATTKHSVNGLTGTTGSIGKLASTWVLPPTLTAQYHPIASGPIRPYIGAGINYTLFYSEKPSTGLEGAVGATKVKLTNSFGWAAQAGVDIDVSKKMFFNIDVKYIDIDTTAKLQTTALGLQKVRVHLDPLVFGFGIGFRL